MIAPNLDIGAGIRYWSSTPTGHMNFQDVVSTVAGLSAQVANFPIQRTQASWKPAIISDPIPA